MLFAALTQVLDPDPHSAAENMAIDEALLASATQPLLRIYRWARPAVSFGYFTPWAEVARACPGREPVRRWTGGGIVPHGEDCTYTLIVPRSEPFFHLRPLESYRAIHAALARALRNATLAPAPTTLGSSECFAAPVEYDVLIGETKVAGAAQRRTRSGLLHQGSVQLTSDRAAFAAALPSCFSEDVISVALDPAIHAAASALAEQKYATDAWLHRR